MSRVKVDTRNAWQDLSSALQQRGLWMALGWNDVKTRYHRSRLGIFWAGLSLLIFVGAIGPIYASLSDVSLREYIMHLLLGFIVWNYVSGIISECSREFVNATNYLVSFQLSYFTLLLRVVWRNMVVLAYQMMVFILFALILQHTPQWQWLMIPLSLLLITINALWMGLLISVFATRYRDLGELLNNLLRLIFFVTPIIWMPSFDPGLQTIADLNPFYHLIEIFRAPLSGGSIALLSWVVVLIMPLAGWLLAFPIFARYRSRIAFWL